MGFRRPHGAHDGGAEVATGPEVAGRLTAGRCPTCHGPRGPNPHGPFCSERCRLADLHQWLEGAYCIATEPTDSPLDSSEGED